MRLVFSKGVGEVAHAWRSLLALRPSIQHLRPFLLHHHFKIAVETDGEVRPAHRVGERHLPRIEVAVEDVDATILQQMVQPLLVPLDVLLRVLQPMLLPSHIGVDAVLAVQVLCHMDILSHLARLVADGRYLEFDVVLDAHLRIVHHLTHLQPVPTVRWIGIAQQSDVEHVP